MDMEKKDAFSRKLIDILNGGSLNAAMGLGYRLGLFEAMAGIDTFCSSAQLAEAAGYSERYVREWLGVMASGGVVECRAEGGGDTFFLPREHAALITKSAGPENLGVYTQEIPLLTMLAMEKVERGFRTGDGVEYENYPAFQAFMSELAAAKHRLVLVGEFLPGVDEGRVVEKLKSGIRVCDLGCGEGTAALLMAEAFPAGEFVGLDISDEALDAGRAEASRMGLANISFVKADAAGLESGSRYAEYFDYVTAFDAIHDQTAPLAALRGARAILKKGGAFSMVDIAAESGVSGNLDHPMGPFLYTVSLLHCMPVGLAGGGSGLGMMWGRQKALALLNEAGFSDVRIEEIANDSFNDHYFCVK